MSELISNDPRGHAPRAELPRPRNRGAVRTLNCVHCARPTGVSPGCVRVVCCACTAQGKGLPKLRQPELIGGAA